MSRTPQPALLRLLERWVPPHEAFRRGLSFYPPYLGAGVVVTACAPDFSACTVELRAHRWNRNYVGTHFGGSLSSMADPFYMLLLLRRLGPGYVVWDKASSIRFRRPARGTIRATFVVDDDRVASIVARLAGGQRSLDESFQVDLTDEEGQVVASVDKVVYIRRKPPRDEGKA